MERVTRSKVVMQRGYVKLWRKSIDAGWLSNHKLWAFWCWCLMKASHKEHDMIVGCQQVHLIPGEFVFGLNKASEELEMSIRSIRTILDFLKKSKNLTIKTTNKFSVISIVNWHTYQSDKIENDKQNDKPPTNNRQATDNKQECKELKNVKNKEYTSDFLEFYTAYPKHKARDDAFKAWNGLNGKRPPLSELLTAIEKQKESEDWKKENGKWIPFPATWLRAGRWDDELTLNLENEKEAWEV
jgi:hypothetical protein